MLHTLFRIKVSTVLLPATLPMDELPEKLPEKFMNYFFYEKVKIIRITIDKMPCCQPTL